MLISKAQNEKKKKVSVTLGYLPFMKKIRGKYGKDQDL